MFTGSIPLIKSKSLLKLLYDLGLENTTILRQSANILYESYKTYKDILDCPYAKLEEERKKRLSNSSVLTGLADQSTDIVSDKQLDIYKMTRPDDMKPNTHYITNIGYKDSTGAGIAPEISFFYSPCF